MSRARKRDTYSPISSDELARAERANVWMDEQFFGAGRAPEEQAVDGPELIAARGARPTLDTPRPQQFSAKRGYHWI